MHHSICYPISSIYRNLFFDLPVHRSPLCCHLFFIFKSIQQAFELVFFDVWNSVGAFATVIPSCSVVPYLYNHVLLPGLCSCVLSI